MAPNSPLLAILCLLALTAGGSAFRQRPQLPRQQQPPSLQSLNPLEPARRIQHEAGFTDVWDQTSDQIQFAGVAASRHLIQQGGLLLPSFNNAPLLAYVAQGKSCRGIIGVINPGCAETFQSTKPTEAGGRFGSERFRDQYQKIHRIRKGDIVALEAGVAHWVHNDANQDLELVVVHDTSNADNQLDQNLRRFFLAGSPQETEKQQTRYAGQYEEIFSGNIFQGFETEVLAESFKVPLETAERLQGQDDNRGFIVRVGKEFEASRYEEDDERRERRQGSNGFEESICTRRIRENLDDPERADHYTARGGRISTLNSYNLPILKRIQLSAERGVLYQNSLTAPQWSQNAHNIIYILRGSGRIQVVGHSNKAVFNGEVRQGQLLVVPQNYAEVKLAGDEGLEWVSFKTNDKAVSSPLAGKTSVIRAMPEEVVMSAFRVSRDQAQKLKFNRPEAKIFPQSKKGSRWSIA